MPDTLINTSCGFPTQEIPTATYATGMVSIFIFTDKESEAQRG